MFGLIQPDPWYVALIRPDDKVTRWKVAQQINAGKSLEHADGYMVMMIVQMTMAITMTITMTITLTITIAITMTMTTTNLLHDGYEDDGDDDDGDGVSGR